LTATQLDGLWSDLGSDAAKAHKVIWQLARNGDQSTALLAERLRPTPPTDAQQLAVLLADLGSDKFATRQKAMQALTDLGEQAEAALRKLLADTPPLEVRQRVESILAKRDNDPEWIRRLRGIETLEHIGTPQAMEVLETLAKITPNPQISQGAAAALKRLGKARGEAK
jgi:HEAT repeat protein